MSEIDSSKESNFQSNKEIIVNHDRTFYPLDEFPKFKILEENYYELLDELLKVLQENPNIEKVFEPWIERNLYQDSNENGWDVAPLKIGGALIEDRCILFPKLKKLTDQISGIVSISYSMLKPGTHIVAHKGYDDYSEKILRYHMGMIVPEGDIGIRVEKDIRGWDIGKSFIFDDFLIHEAWNFSDKNRIVLIIDFLRNEFLEDNSNQLLFIDKNFNKSTEPYLKQNLNN
jgi:aspartyl/asparaginyl beta-hydroxylase (cupin superfamily)